MRDKKVSHKSRLATERLARAKPKQAVFEISSRKGNCYTGNPKHDLLAKRVKGQVMESKARKRRAGNGKLESKSSQEQFGTKDLA